ncbi:MAG: ParA family protein [Aquabacterium sp.]|jgi:chromosome partitioning protein|uniref:ParA family protein n=1 Tax=Aquabacterium sp. TaxID=1872578 RepID=UPI001B557B1B|nr:ParA family protein [Aquabacterium sp.]MBP7132692.1 ParA family protein [Aquabacterium sp.]MDQ5926093.1 Cobyrinic acid a,c-diamide synthase [Pseudomonadota bacterium]
MPVIVVANPKGGVGKSTLSSNIAGYFARQGHSVMLGDIDRQQSSRLWLQLRPDTLPTIQSWDIDRDDIVRPPKGTTHVVLDTPAGLHGKRLQAVMKLADHILVPLQASVFDIYATQDFLAELHRHKRSEKVKLGVVANRVKDHTKAAEHLQTFLRSLDIPWLAQLRDTQNYTHLAAHGLSLWDVPPHKVDKDLTQWRPILDWLVR